MDIRGSYIFGLRKHQKKDERMIKSWPKKIDAKDNGLRIDKLGQEFLEPKKTVSSVS